MIVQREITLRRGVPVKFKVAPVDPYDALRGRYVLLRFEACRNPVKMAQEDAVRRRARLRRGERVYAVLRVDDSGFAKIVEVRRRPPKEGLYVAAWVRYAPQDGAVVLRLPFEHFYMDEYRAPRAEDLLRRRTAREQHPAYVVVRVLRGRAVLEDLYVDDRPIAAWLEKGRPRPAGPETKPGNGARAR